ncbi:protein neuralized isoform X2 [Drosophila innubila]|uniref:protein neuralized isoform X2 n=1 Tax=Drosophila innubila TaxID=198719 RepID=UPI00148DAA8F|nr:protein neuralized isoform X2 [Drosophila innubila]
MGQSAGKIVRRSPSSCPGPNNLPPLQFHQVHGDNIRISRDGTLARRFESFCRAITFSARPVRINERICVKFAEISNNWNGGIRFGFTSNDPATLEGALPKYACPDLTNRPGFWAKALHEQYCEKDNILYYYVNNAGDVIYGINNEEKGVILSGIDTRALLWTVIDIYGNCTGIEFLDARIYMYQQQQQQQLPLQQLSQQLQQQQQPLQQQQQQQQQLPQQQLSAHHPLQQSRRSLPGGGGVIVDHELERHVMPSLQSLHLAGTVAGAAGIAEHDLANGLPPLRYNANGRLIPVPFHITKGRNVRLSHDRFVASRTESDFCQGYVFTARPIRIGEKLIVQVLKTEQMYVGALALGLTSCNPAVLQPNDLPNDSDFLLDRPEYWVVSKDIAAAPQRGDEIAFFVAPNGEVSISKNNGPAVVVMHVDQSLQLWAFLDVYGSTQSLRMFRQQLPNMVAYPSQPQISAGSAVANATSANGSRILPMAESLNSLNAGQLLGAAKMQLNVTQSNSTLASATNGTGSRMISMPSNGDILQIQPNGGGTVLVVNLPPANSSHDLNGQLTAATAATVTSSGILAGACSSGTLISTTSSQQYIEPIAQSTSTLNGSKWKDSLSDQQSTDSSAECTICYENPIDSVLYMCGHMCMCYDCAIEQWRGVGGGQCPLCRAVIRDVIRTYTT